jgi:hypothetical protein
VGQVPPDTQPEKDHATEADRDDRLAGDPVDRGTRSRPCGRWTAPGEPQFLAKDYGNDASAEYLQFFKLGVDGVFSDFPDTAVRARAVLGELSPGAGPGARRGRAEVGPGGPKPTLVTFVVSC